MKEFETSGAWKSSEVEIPHQTLPTISARPSKQPLMVRTFLKVYMELGFYFLFLQEQIKDIIILQKHNIITAHSVHISSKNFIHPSIRVLPRSKGLPKDRNAVRRDRDKYCWCVCLLLQYLLQSMKIRPTDTTERRRLRSPP